MVRRAAALLALLIACLLGTPVSAQSSESTAFCEIRGAESIPLAIGSDGGKSEASESLDSPILPSKMSLQPRDARASTQPQEVAGRRNGAPAHYQASAPPAS